MKKIIALLLACVMVLGLFAACGSSDSTETTKATTAANNSAETKATEAPSAEIPTLKWVQVGSGMPGNYDAWKANLDAYLEEKIGVHLDVEVVGWGEWDTRRNMIVSTNEPYDIMFTNSGTFYNDVAMGAFADISGILETAAPALKEFIPEAYWNACKVNGGLYAVPTYKDSSMTNYLVYDKNLVESAYPDYANVHTGADLGPVLEAMYAANENQPVFRMTQGGTHALYSGRFDAFSSTCNLIGVRYTDDTATVVSVFEQEDVMAELRRLHEWYQAGYINQDAPILTEQPNAYNPVGIAQGWSYAAVTTWGPNMGCEAVAIQYENTVLSNETVQGSMSCISAASKYPEKCLQLLELVNTDSYVRDALFYGLEGDNFDYTADGKVHRNNTDWTMAGYTQGTFFVVTQQDTEEVNQWDEVRALNEQAIASPVLGFSFNLEPVADQIAACQAIWKDYQSLFNTGSEDPDVIIPQMLEEAYDAGLQEIIDEAQAQIDAWKNA